MLKISCFINIIDLHKACSTYTYAPIVSVDVESLFSTYKNILLDNRVRFTTVNLVLLIFVAIML
ncbi:Uncharacterized protein FWK35_00009730 [Aphis craccivora]|uniref:Dimer Tnp hAT domain-containing protein n=1 Tax=Aphis craccivora TaxID=307492 RepID=A0A6G0ZP10_APHCR|nr:Uncharacterized protein FWK35_00009730 [Aphis craccivora]